MQNQVPNLAGKVATDASNGVGVLFSTAIEGAITAARVARVVKEVPNDVVDSALTRLEEALEIVNHFVQHGEAPPKA